VVAALRGMGVLMPGDLIAVEAFCEAYGDYVGARAAIAARGQHYETRTPSGGIMRRADPAVADMRDADKRLRAWGSELGLSPVSRTRAEKAPTERDALAARYFS
jgi:P27 family predicted phage terminase small subunit